MKIKTDGKIIGILCSAEEETAAFDALVDLGIDGYIIHTENYKGNTVLCFMREDLPSQLPDFESKFISLFNKNMSPVTLFHEEYSYDCFSWIKASIGGKRLFQYA